MSAALVECDPLAPQLTKNQFLLQPIPTLSTSTLEKLDLCSGRWWWYQVDTEYSRATPVTQRSTGADGVVRTETVVEYVPDTAAVVVTFDTIWTRQANRFPTSDIVIVNGRDNRDQITNWNNPAFFDPQAAAADNPENVVYYPSVDSLTHTVGFNTTFGSAGCAAHVESKIYVAVRCNWGISLACRYNIGATKLPRRIYDGDQITTSIAPGELHYYAVDIGAFDVVRLTLLRYNHDLAYTDDDGNVRTYDFALRGELVAQRGSCPNPEVSPPPPPPPTYPSPGPPPSSMSDEGDGDSTNVAGDDGTGMSTTATAAVEWSLTRSAPITNSSGTAEVEFFCTTVDESGPYAVAVAADLMQGPVGLPFEATETGAADCSYGYVGPHGVPIFSSEAAPGAMPQCNPGGGSNELKLNRPIYVLDVVHSRFSAVPLAAHEERPACISYGQMRRYTVTTSGETAANLFLALSTTVSRVYIKEGAPPTMESFDAASFDPAQAFSGGSHAMLPLTSVSASTPTPAVQSTWHFAIYLSSEAEAKASGLAPSAFIFNSTLRSARRAQEGSILPTSAGGDGSVCCGAMTHYLVLVNSSLLSLRVRLTVTMGSVRAVYLKFGSVAAFPQDISGQQCNARTQLCHMTWYERYDRYTGQKRFTTSNQTLVPAGGDYPDKRSVGDWYISVQDAGVSHRTEFHMSIDQVAAGAGSDADDDCDRFGRYDCSHDLWKVPADLFSSSAIRYRTPARTWMNTSAMIATGLLASLVLTGLHRGGRRRAVRAAPI